MAKDIYSTPPPGEHWVQKPLRRPARSAKPATPKPAPEQPQVPTNAPELTALAPVSSLAGSAQPLATSPSANGEGPSAASVSPDIAAARDRKAVDVCQYFELADEDHDYLEDNATVVDFLARLREARYYEDATRFLAHALPKREAVWWASQCVRGPLELTSLGPLYEVLKATHTWVQDPSEQHRRACLAASETAGLDQPAGLVAMAAFLSNGSLGPPQVAPIPPGPFLTAKAVAGAIMLAAVQTNPETAPNRYEKFLAFGTEVLLGKNLCK